MEIDQYRVLLNAGLPSENDKGVGLDLSTLVDGLQPNMYYDVRLQVLVCFLFCHMGRPWLNQHSTCSCTTNVYKLDASCWHGFNPYLCQYVSRVSCPCGLTVVYEISPSLNLASRDITCTEWNRL